jgi:hypothetical protein
MSVQPPPAAFNPAQARYVTPVSPSQPQAARTDVKQQQAQLSDLFKIQEAGHGTPGQGGRLNPDPCPNCGGPLFIENLGGKRRGPPPAPHCFNCGHNGLFEQGLASNWGA